MKWGSFLGASAEAFDKSFSGVPDTYDKYQKLLTGKAARKAQEEADAKAKQTNAAPVPTAPTPTTPTDATVTPGAEGGGGESGEETGNGSYDPKAKLKGAPPAPTVGSGDPYVTAPSGYGSGLQPANYIPDRPLGGTVIDLTRTRAPDTTMNAPEGPTVVTRDPTMNVPEGPAAIGSGSALATAATPAAPPNVPEGPTPAAPAPRGSVALSPKQMYGGSVPGAPPAPSVWDKAKDAGKAIQKGYRDFEQRNRAADPTPMKPSDMYGSQPRASSAPALSEPAGDGAGAFAPAAPAQAPAQAPANTFRPTKRRTDGRSSDARQPVDPRYPSRAVPMQVASYLPGGPSLANTAVRPLDMLQALRTSGFG